MHTAWKEWHDRCAIILCGKTTQSELREFGATRFKRYLDRYASFDGVRNTSPLMVSPADAWHLLETRCVTHHSKQGKSYKDWLFARADGREKNVDDVIEGGAALMMRDVVRDYLRREIPPQRTVSYDLLIENGYETNVSVLLPYTVTPHDVLSTQEVDGLADESASQAFQASTHREKIALLAKATGKPLTHQAVLGAAGCGKSVLSTAYRRLLSRLADNVQQTFPDESPDSLISITLLTLNKLTVQIVESARKDAQYKSLVLQLEDALS